MIDQLIESMLAFCNERGLLQHYRDDLLVHDRRVLSVNLPDWPCFVWVARKMGTYLYPVGFHPWQNESLISMLRNSDFGEDAVICWLTPNDREPIKQVSAMAAVSKIAGMPCLRRVDSVIVSGASKRNSGQRLGYLSLDFRERHQGYAIFEYTAPCADETNSQALPESWVEQFALCEATAATDLFIKVASKHNWQRRLTALVRP